MPNSLARMKKLDESAGVNYLLAGVPVSACSCKLHWNGVVD
jgi:hypothetical protein